VEPLAHILLGLLPDSDALADVLGSFLAEPDTRLYEWWWGVCSKIAPQTHAQDPRKLYINTIASRANCKNRFPARGLRKLTKAINAEREVDKKAWQFGSPFLPSRNFAGEALKAIFGFKLSPLAVLVFIDEFPVESKAAGLNFHDAFYSVDAATLDLENFSSYYLMHFAGYGMHYARETGDTRFKRALLDAHTRLAADGTPAGVKRLADYSDVLELWGALA
jgi:hypothetical protein